MPESQKTESNKTVMTMPEHVVPAEATETFFNLSLDLLCIADTDGHFRYLNDRWSQVLGWEIDELYEKPFIEFVHPDDREATMQELEKLRCGEDTIYFHNRYLCKGGAYRWFSWTCPAPLEGSNLLYAIARDVTEQRFFEECLETANQELKRSNQELDEFAASIAHDLKAPMFLMQVTCDMMRSQYGDAFDKQSNEQIQKTKDVLYGFQQRIDALLLYARLNSDKNSFEEVDLNQVIADVCSDLDAHIQNLGAEIDCDRLVTIEARTAQMEQLFQNILSNALKFHKPHQKPQIKISVKLIEDRHPGITATDTVVEICVQDNGIGFSQYDLAQIFIPFRRLAGAEGYEGTGIGLSLCRKIVQLHHGQITAKSEPDVGTTFYITLPLKQSSEP